MEKLSKEQLRIVRKAAGFAGRNRKAFDEELRSKGLIGEEFQEGWYKSDRHVVYLSDPLNNLEELKAYGVIVNPYSEDYWFESEGFEFEGRYKMEKATDKDVENALIEEAKRRGFNVGVKVESLFKGYSDTLSDNYKFDEYGELWCWGDMCGILLFKNGKWAKKPEEKPVSFVDFLKETLDDSEKVGELLKMAERIEKVLQEK